MRLAINHNQKRLPIGGHQYHDHGATFTGETFEEVSDKLRDFRLNNGIPIGDPKQDVLQHYVKNWPYMVIAVEDDEDEEEEDKDYTAWRYWVHKTWKFPPNKTITSKEASMRWEVCKGCRFNLKADFGYDQEAMNIRRKLFMLRRGIAVPDYLGFCTCHKVPISFFSFIDEAVKFSEAKDTGACDGCWVSKAK